MAVAQVANPASAMDAILQPLSTERFNSFSFMPFLKKEYRFGLDPNREICRFFLQGHCPLGNDCPDKHTTNTGFNKTGSLVCKHWLRSLCKKGEACEFLHEYNLRKMPECNFFIRNGYCSNGEECLYLHIDPESKIPLCPHYEKGFCQLGPECSKKHVRKTICKFYLAGFCPEGRQNCKEGTHPRWTMNLAPPTTKAEREERRWGQDDAGGAEGGETGSGAGGGGGGGGGRGGRRDFSLGNRRRGGGGGGWGGRDKERGGHQDRDNKAGGG